MSDQGFREIQLGGKQLVFLFMASVVVAVAVFLLGVSVGRGVRNSTPTSGEVVDAEQAAADATPTVMPPPTTLSPADQGYSSLDKSAGAGTGGSGAPGASESVAEAPTVSEPVPQDATPPAPVTPAGTTAPAAANAASAPKATAAAPARAPARTPPPSAAATTKPRDEPAKAATGQWVVQINAFRSRDAADRQVGELKSRGHAAFVLAGDGMFRVRVGPFRDKAEAERTAARFTREGMRPLVTR
jgi:cell division septation protein DedD